MSRCEGSSLHFQIFGLRSCFLKKALAGGKQGWERRVETVQEMAETVETVQGLWDGIQVHSSFHTDVKHDFVIFFELRHKIKGKEQKPKYWTCVLVSSLNKRRHELQEYTREKLSLKLLVYTP
jgi:hypothetical protein